MAEAAVREKVAIGLAKALAGEDVPDDEEALALAALGEEIEGAMFDEFKGTSKDYKSKYRTLIFNLNDEKNPTLRTRVRARALSVQDLITLDAKALASEEMQLARQEIQDRYFATRQQVDGDMLVGWQAGTSGSLNTHKNTDVNKLGTQAVEEPTAPASPAREEDEYALMPGAEHADTPLPMEDNGTPLNEGEDEGHGFEPGGDSARPDDDDDIWGVNEEDLLNEEPPAKAQKRDAGAGRGPHPPSAPRPMTARPSSHPPLPGYSSPDDHLAAAPRPPPAAAAAAAAASALAAVPAVKVALRGTEWLFPADVEFVIADASQLREKVGRAYAIRDRLCGSSQA
ncbi:transcription factor S-II, central domain-containing protein [Pavlovales sp. CCMP2436]|nr:transcription factor S-II, central domain-containing protein [Pavlovales sp. CCMP2436]